MLTDWDLLICHLGISQKIITETHVSECLTLHTVNLEKKKNDVPLTRILLAKEYLTVSQLHSLERILDQAGRKNLVDGYEIISLIGQGAMGRVFKAKQISMDRIVALKILPFEMSSNDIFIERFMREARAAGKLNHPNIIQGYDVGECKGVYFFAMEYVEGDNVGVLLKTKGRFSEKEALDIVIQVSKALERAYEFGIVHRDIKPENIIITPSGQVKVADLGLVRFSFNEGDGQLTMVGTIIGTPLYISPEQAKGLLDIDTKSDIYSLGITLYNMVTGKVPFDGASPSVIMAKHIAEDIPDPRLLSPDLSEELYQIFLKMTKKKREERYQTPSKLLDDLNSLVNILNGFETTSQNQIKADLPKKIQKTRGESTKKIEPGKEDGKKKETSQSIFGKESRFKFSHAPSEKEVHFILIALKNKVISESRLMTVLAIQEHDAEKGHLDSIDRILARRGDIPEKHCQIMLEAHVKAVCQEDDQSFISVSKEFGIVTDDQINDVTRLQDMMGKVKRYSKICDIMETKHFVTADQKNRIIKESARRKQEREDIFFGKLVIKTGFLTSKEVDKAFKHQAGLSKENKTVKLSDILVSMDLLKEDQKQALLRAQRLHEMLGRPFTTSLNEKLLKPFEKDEEVEDIQGIFDGITLKATQTEKCPFCGEEIPSPPPAQCKSCGKSLF